MNGLLDSAFGLDASQLATGERQRLLSRLVSRLAHEVRNPLSSLDIHVQLLTEDLSRMGVPAPPHVAERLEIIRHEVSRLDNIVRQFLTLAGPSPVNLQPVDVRDLLRHVCRVVSPEAEARRIALEVHAAPDLPEFWADPAQLTQACLNLVLNALHAIQRDGRVLLSVSTDGTDVLRIDVRDTGPGINPENRLAIFEPFFTTKPEGSGLGLWIVQQIATAHRGSVSAANHPEGGAVVSLRLPRRNSSLLPPAS